MAWLQLGFTVILIALTGLLVTAEFALVRVRPTRLEELSKDGSRRAAAALKLIHELGYTLATTQVGITLASLGIGWMGEPATAVVIEPLLRPLGEEVYVRPISLAIGFLLITLVTVILGELVPKAIGIQRAETMLLLAAGPLRLLRLLLYPIVALTNASAGIVLKALGLSHAYGREESAHSEEELRSILGRSYDRGHIGRVGRDILDRVLGFSKLTARQIMVPRPDVVWLSTARTPAENLEIARSSGYTRFPFCDGDLDRVIGIVHIKDVILTSQSADLMAVMRPPLVFPETATADQLLRMFQRRKLHLAMVVDEYGGTSGIGTLEDVLEDIVGEVQDEFDQEPPDIAALDGEFQIKGTARLETVAKTLGADDDVEDIEADTIAGFVQASLGRLANLGDTVELGPFLLRVDEVQGNRIVKLSAKRKPEPPPAADEAAPAP